MTASSCLWFSLRVLSRLTSSTPTSVTSPPTTLHLGWPVPPRLTTRKRGEGVKHSRAPKQLHQQSYPKPGIPLIRERVLRASFFRDHSGAYYSKTGSVRKTVSPRASITKFGLCGFCSETTSTHYSVQHEGGRIESGVLPPLNILQLENGGSGSSRKFQIATFVEPLQLDNGG